MLFRSREPPGDGPVQRFLAERARALGLWIVGGTLPLQAADEAHVYNTSFAWSPEGECVARYDKIHLFGFDNGSERYQESLSIAAGSTPVAFDSPFGRIALSICYDLRFAELYRSLAPVDLIFVPSSFTAVTGEKAFTLTRAQYDAFAAKLAPYRPESGEVRYAPGQKNCPVVATDMPSVDVTWTRAIGDKIGRAHV